jgi:tetratricopeptide (TPR) repeat protein
MQKTVTAILPMLIYGGFVLAAERGLSAGKTLRLGTDRQYDQDTAKVNYHIRRGFYFLSSKSVSFDEVKLSIDSAVLICTKKDIEVPASLHLLLARYHYATGDLRTSSEEAAMALRKSSENRQNDVLAKTYLFLGDYYRRTGMFQESMEYYNNAISVGKKQKLKRIIPESYIGIANIYFSLDDMKGYRENLELLIESAKAENASRYLVAGYHRYGTSFLGDTSTSERRNFRVADSLLRKSIEISSAIRDTSYIALSTANLGWNFYLEQKYDSSVACYERSLKYSIRGKLFSISANSMGNLGTIYRDLGQTAKALFYYRQGIESAHRENDLYELWWIHRDMSDLYLRNRDTTNAYLNYVLFKKYSDAFNKGVSSQGLADARIRYEADTHNKEVELLSLRLKNNRLLNYGFAGFILLITFIGLLLFRGSKLKDKRRLSELNRKVSEITQANLRQQMNPHFIFNTLNSIQYYMYQHDKIATNNYLTKFSTLMRKVLDNSRSTSVPLSDELIALNLYLELEKLRFRDKFEYSITIDDEIDPLMHRIPTMLIQPYVENSINHGLIPGEGKGLVSIDLKLKDGFILCTIEDNGIGRDASREMNKKRGENHNSLGTRITASRLDLVNELYGSDLKIVYYDLKNEKDEPRGTKVEIHIPIIT